jgi:hypothetical protein
MRAYSRESARPSPSTDWLSTVAGTPQCPYDECVVAINHVGVQSLGTSVLPVGRCSLPARPLWSLETMVSMVQLRQAHVRRARGPK